MNISISPNFKKQTKSTIISIIIFVIVYILLFILALGITIALGLLGIWIISQSPSFITIVLGGGLIASGLTILFFLIKFIFSSDKIDRTHLTEIKKADHPQIFFLIDEIVKEVNTSFPKKVYLSNDVNASVFYDSNFWSMFLPIKKNLIIGIGLMNSVTQQEFQAILAHEFGHFSQRSMKVGSYVYQVNQVIYNMLYKNDSLDNVIGKTASVHGIIAICIAASVWVIKQIQYILQKLYHYININYMSLSREMEFHADEIAAHVAGSKYLASSLLRLDFANHALESTFSFYDQKIKENIKSRNVYEEQSFIMHFLAKENKYNLNHNLPQIETEHLSKYNKSKLNIENQWASHPNTEDRIKALNKLNIPVEHPNNSPAIDLLNDKYRWMELMTAKIYDNINFSDATTSLSLDQFQTSFSKDYEKNNFDTIFNNYYTFNNPIVNQFDIDIEESRSYRLKELFDDNYVNLMFETNAAKEDFSILKSIESSEIKIKTFDYDGKKYNNNEASDLIKLVENEIKEKEEHLTNHNKLIYKSFMSAAHKSNLDSELKKAYIDFKLEEDHYSSKIELYNQLNDKTQFIFVTVPFGQIEANLKELLPYEHKLKKELSLYLRQTELLGDLDDETINNLKYYTQKELLYFNVDSYDDSMLNYLFTAINYYLYFISKSYFLKKQAILNLKKQIMLSEEN